jgi:hypothetical protein
MPERIHFETLGSVTYVEKKLVDSKISRIPNLINFENPQHFLWKQNIVYISLSPEKW